MTEEVIEGGMIEDFGKVKCRKGLESPRKIFRR